MQDRLSLCSSVQISEGVLSRDLQGEEVILNLNTGVYFGLDAYGTRIWHLIQQHRSLQKVLDALLEEYEVSASRCAQDLLEFVSQLKKNRLLVIGNEPAP